MLGFVGTFNFRKKVMPSASALVIGTVKSTHDFILRKLLFVRYLIVCGESSFCGYPLCPGW